MSTTLIKRPPALNVQIRRKSHKVQVSPFTPTIQMAMRRIDAVIVSQKGAQGQPGETADPGDLTLWFNNALI